MLGNVIKEAMDNAKRMEREAIVMDHVSKLEGYEFQDVLGGMTDSLIIELSKFIKDTEGREEVDKVLKHSRKVIDSMRKEMSKENREGNTYSEMLKLSLSSLVVFSTFFNSLNSTLEEISKCDVDCAACDNCDGVNIESLKKSYEEGNSNDEELVVLLKRGLITVNDLQENFGTEVATNVLDMASKELKENEQPKEQPKTCDCKNCTCENDKDEIAEKREARYRKDFEKIIRQSREGRMTMDQFKDSLKSIPLDLQLKFMEECGMPVPHGLRETLNTLGSFDIEELLNSGKMPMIAVVEVRDIKKK